MIRFSVRRAHRSHRLHRHLLLVVGIVAVTSTSMSLPSFALMADQVRSSTTDALVTTVDDTTVDITTVDITTVDITTVDITTVDDALNSEAPDPTTNDFLDLERSLTECISSNPPPGCGRVPTSPGDRGGWQQLVLFGVMMGGISVIFWRVARAVRRRDTPVQAE